LLTHIVIEEFKTQKEKLNSLIESQKISDELKYKKTFDVTIKAIEEKILSGKLIEAYYRIKSIINLDELNKAPKYKNDIILFETKIVLIRELKEEYNVQLDKLEMVKNCFLKFYYQLRLYKIIKKEVDIDEFLKETNGQEYALELRLCLLQLNDFDLEYIKELELNYPAIKEESKAILIKNYIISCINSNSPNYSEKLIKDNDQLLTDYDSKYYIYLLELNKFLRTKLISELSLSDTSFLQSNLEKMLNINDKFKEHSLRTRRSVCYNIILTKIQLKKAIEEIKDDIEFISNDSELLLRLLKTLNNLFRFEDITVILNSSKLKYNKEIVDEYIEALFKKLDFEQIIQENFNQNELSLESKAKIIAAKNFILHREKETTFSESDIELLFDDPENPTVLVSICNIFIINKEKRLAKKYFDKMYQNIDTLNEQDKLVLTRLAELLEENDIEEKIINNLIDIRPQYKIVKAKFYQRITNNFHELLAPVDKFFSGINIEDNLPPEIFRIKSEYLRISGETDKFWILLKHLINIYDNENDWYVYIGSLIDFGKIDAVEELIPEIQSRLDNPLFEFILGVSYLHIETLKENKLSKFSYHFLRAFQKIKALNQRFNENILVAVLNTLLINQLHIEYDKKYVSAGCYIQLTKKDSTEKLVLCIHEKKELTAPINDGYLEAIHLHKNDDLLKEILLREIGEVIVLNKETHIIDNIDSIYNYPEFYLSQLVFTNPEKYGLTKIKIGPDPVTSIHPQMLELKKQQDQVYNAYAAKNLTMFFLSGTDYLNYIQIIQRLLFSRNFSLNAGFGKNLSTNHKFVLSYTAIIILELFDKLRTIPNDRIMVSKSLVDVINKHYQTMRSSIDNSKLSLDLDENLIPYKIETTSDTQLEETQRWQKLLSKISQYESFDTSAIEDDLTPLIRLIGKIEVDCIRISNMKQIPIIIDDRLVQKFLRFSNTSNVIGFYFYQSNDTLDEKLRILLALSKMNYKYVLFEGLLEEIINIIIKENYTSFGENTVISNFILLIKYELNKVDKSIQYNSFLGGCNLLIASYLNPTAERILKNLLLLIKANDKSKLFNDLKDLNKMSGEKILFIEHCFT